MTTMTLESYIPMLRQAAEEMRRDNHYGWGNACEFAAAAITAHLAAEAKAVPLNDWLNLAGIMYQASGAYDMPVRFLDALSKAANGKVFAHLLNGLLPVESPAAQDAVSDLVTAAREAECACSLRERDSGHRIECWMPALKDALESLPRGKAAQQELVMQNANPNNDSGSYAVAKHGVFIYRVDFEDGGHGNYVRLKDFNAVCEKLEAQHAQPSVPVDRLEELMHKWKEGLSDTPITDIWRLIAEHDSKEGA